MSNSSGAGLSRSHSRAVATIVAFLLLLTGAVVLAPATARAASGTVNSIELVKVYDGAQVPNSLDPAPDNGVVASNDALGFRWDLNATDLVEGVFTQTLPAGWAWDTTSLGTLDSTSSAYQASYAISDGGRTLTATISVGSGGGSPTITSFGVLNAVPSGDIPSGSVYNPVLAVDVDGAVQTVAASRVSVVNEPRAELLKALSFNNRSGEFDFGSGPEDARYMDFRLTVQSVAKMVGARNTQLQQPLRIADSYTLSTPAGYENVPFTAQIVARSEAGATPTLTQSGTDLDIVLDGFNAMPSAWVTVRFWVKSADMPSNAAGPLTVINTASPVSWRDVEGNPVAEDPANNTAQGSVLQAGGVTNTARGKNILLYDDQSGDPSLTADPGRPGAPFTNVNAKDVSVGSRVASRFHVRPAVDNSTQTTTYATNLVAYDFWDASQQQIITGADIYVGRNNGTAPLPASDYTIQYTSGTDRNAPENNTWVNSIAAAGGAGAVSGIRIAYTAGAWGGDPAATGHFLVAVPFQLSDTAESGVLDQARWTFTDRLGAQQNQGASQFVNVGYHILQLAKTVNYGSIVSGSALTYTLTPTLSLIPGAEDDVDVSGITITDRLPEGLVSVDTSGVVAPWSVVRTGTPESGLTLTFTYGGTASTADDLPEIAYEVVTSVLAPSGARLVNTAVIDAQGNTQSAASRTASASVTVRQAEVVSEEKVVIGEEQIEVGDPQVSWETRWFNFQTATQGESYFTDVLPYDGDARGTSFSGTARLDSAVITDGAGNPAAADYATLQYTTAPASAVYAAEANDVSIPWVDATGADLSAISGITALRVVVNDFKSGIEGVGGLLVTMDVAGQRSGDRYVNNTNAWLGTSGKLGLSNRAAVTVLGSSLGGTVWEDGDGDGARVAGESPVGGATVRLLDSAGTVVDTAQTGADGSYLFTQLHSGDYRAVVDASTLGFPSNYVVLNTYDLDGTVDSDSGVVSLGRGEDRARVDFGYLARVSEIGLVKSGRLEGEARAGGWVAWEFEIANAGENPLTDVELTDHLQGVVDLRVAWPGSAGALAAGATAPATARYQLTQEDIDRGYVRNTATVQGLDPNRTTVEDSAEATVTLPDGGSLLLEKDGVLLGKAVAGGEVEWSFTLTNTGNVTLDGIRLHDELEGLQSIVWGQWPGDDFVLRPGESVTATAGYALTQADVDAGFVENVADSDGKTPGAREVPSNEDDARVQYASASAISLVKKTNEVEYDSAPGAQLQIGGDVSWSYEVANTGDTTLVDVKLVDDQEGVIPAPDGFDGVLDPGESVTYTAKGVASEGEYHNVAVVTAEAPGGARVDAEDESWYTAAAEPGDTARKAGPGLVLTGGQMLPTLILGLLLAGVGIAMWLRRRRA